MCHSLYSFAFALSSNGSRENSIKLDVFFAKVKYSMDH